MQHRVTSYTHRRALGWLAVLPLLLLACGPGSYELGDEGPGGGIIVFVDERDAYDDFTYLEVAPPDWSDQGRDPAAPWGCSGAETGATGARVGDGRANTTAILDRCNERPIAASLADELRLGGQRDWFLPSSFDLDVAMNHFNDRGLTGFVGDGYWSSTELSGVSAPQVAEGMRQGSIGGTADKHQRLWVRPMRTF